MIEKLYYVVTTRCNVGCEFCYYATGVLDHVSEELSAAGAAMVVEAAGAIGVNTIAFTGGEPLLRPDIVDLVATAHRAGVRTILVSSGVGLTPNMARSLAEAHLGKFAISIHHGSAAELRHIKAAIEMLRDADIDVRCNFVLSRRNVSRSGDVLDMIRELPRVGGFFQPLSLPLDNKGHDLYCLSAAPAGEATEALAGMTAWCEAFSLFEYREYLTDFYSKRSSVGRCRICDRTLMIDADGEAYPCFYRTDIALGRCEDARSLRNLICRAREESRNIDAAQCRGEHCLAPYFFAMGDENPVPEEARCAAGLASPQGEIA